MVTLSGSSLTLTDTLVDTASLGLNGANGIASAVVNGTTYIYTASAFDDAIQVSTLSADGTLTPVAVVNDAAGTSIDQAYQVKVFEVAGTQFLAAGGFSDDGVTIYTIGDTAPYLTFADAVFQTDDPDYNLDSTYDIEILTLSGGTFLYVMGNNIDGLSVFEVAASGGLTSVENVDDDATLELNGPHGLASFYLNETQFIAATGFFDDGVSIFSVNETTGALTHTASIDGAADGVLDGADFLDAVVIDGTAYLYVPEQSGNAISVLSFDGSSIELEQRIQSDSALDGAREAEIVEIGDQLFLSVTAFYSSQAHFFAIDQNPLSGHTGELTVLQSLVDNNGEGALSSAARHHSVTIDGTTYLLITGRSDNAVNVYEVGGGDDVVTGGNGADDLSGGAGSDLVSGLGGDDTMSGGAGDDQLDTGSGNDSADGGAGDDVLQGLGGDDTLLGGTGDDDLLGGSGDDSVEGGDGADGIVAGSGNDFARGDNGADWARGGSGADTLSGNDGEDTLRGGDDNDRMFGGNDNDTLAGNAGDDYLRGGNGDDAVFGGTGDDDLGGEAGNDMLLGGLGDDLMRGGDDDDDLLGGRGADTLSGNDGNDLLQGGADADRLIGGLGRDTLEGGSGADVFVFSSELQSAHGSNRDVITDFEDGDMIDLSGFSGTLTFVAGYTGAANEVRYNATVGRLYIDLDGDSASDFSVDVTGAPTIDASDLIL